jgi:hypothetical protein
MDYDTFNDLLPRVLAKEDDFGGRRYGNLSLKLLSYATKLDENNGAYFDTLVFRLDDSYGLLVSNPRGGGPRVCRIPEGWEMLSRLSNRKIEFSLQLKMSYFLRDCLNEDDSSLRARETRTTRWPEISGLKAKVQNIVPKLIEKGNVCLPIRKGQLYFEGDENTPSRPCDYLNFSYVAGNLKVLAQATIGYATDPTKVAIFNFIARNDISLEAVLQKTA